VQLFQEHEQVVVCHEPEAGLRAIIAVHDTTLGPALGGIRMWHYDSDEAALTDVLRLSRGMTYKNAVAGLNLGGGKSVIMGDNRTNSNDSRFGLGFIPYDKVVGRAFVVIWPPKRISLLHGLPRDPTA